jgi:glucose/arabinose dehydrogenase
VRGSGRKSRSFIVASAASLALCLPVRAAAVCGDLNGNETLSATDALVCLGGVVGTVDLTGSCEPAFGCAQDDPPCGDVNTSAEVTATDCRLILSASVFAVDLSSSCNCASPDPCVGIPPAQGTTVAAELVVDNLESPVFVTAPPGDARRLLVVQQHGIVRLLVDGALAPQPFLDISDRVSFLSCCGEEGGLLSIAFHPDYATNGWVFVNYTNVAGDTVIARYEKMPGLDALDASDENRLLTIPQIDPYHNGGQLQFDQDGTLWIGMGDGNGDPGGDQAGTAQDDAELLGKMLRIDVDVVGPPYYVAPPDNPHPGPEPRSLVWAKGLRNPWRFSFDRETGDLYVADVGQNRIEEINYRPAGSAGDENYGWNFFEGSECFAGSCPNRSQFVFPVYEYAHSGSTPNGRSITGGYVYRGCAMPDLHGAYFYADYVSGFVRSLVVAGDAATNHVDRTGQIDPPGARTIENPSSFGEDARGEIYIADYDDGEIYRIVSAQGP